jgi:hypothetical protein
VFGQSSYFERPVAQPPPLPAATAQPPAPGEPTPAVDQPVVATESAEPSATVTAPAPGDWKRESLDRFKKMPGVSKYRRSP